MTWLTEDPWPIVYLGLAVGAIEPDDVNTRRRRGELEKTISRRWADLVEQWKS